MELVQLGIVTALIAIAAQTGAMFYWGGKMAALLETHTNELNDHETRLRLTEKAVAVVEILPCYRRP